MFHLVGKKHALPSAKNVVCGRDWGMDINLRIQKLSVPAVWHELDYCPDDYYEVEQHFPVENLVSKKMHMF